MTAQIAEQLAHLARPLDALHLDPANVRKHGERNLEAIRASLAKFGQRKPVVVQREGMIVRAGNATVQAARALGWTEVAALVVDEGDVTATAYAIADNRSAELAEWDDQALVEVLRALRAGPDALEAAVLGFTDAEIALLEGPVAGLTDADVVVEPPAEPVTEPGDVWTLGEHRVVCGDATCAADVERALAGEAPFLMVTDPPYGVSYDPAWRVRAGLGGAGTATGTVRNDDRADWREAWAFFRGPVAYVWHGGLHAGVVAASLEASGLRPRAQLVWVKHRPVLSRGHYHWQHEVALVGARDGADDRWHFEPEHQVAAYAVRAGETAAWAGDRRQSTVWFVDHVQNETGHGTQKPVECMERPMRNHGAPGDLVYDPFLGSGSSVIAAERSRRRCVGLELDPRYCDVIVRRWEAYTGRKAERRRGV